MYLCQVVLEFFQNRILNKFVRIIVFQAIKKVLEENFHSGEEMDSQGHLFKNSWLEAEAKLCSISYRARFDRMKIEIEKLKSNQKKGRDCLLQFSMYD